MENINYWSSFKDSCSAAWVVTFPENGRFETAILGVLETILKRGLEEEIFILKNKKNEIVCLDEVLNKIKNQGVLSSFIEIFESDYYKSYTKLFFIEGGILTSELVEDTGILLGRLLSNQKQYDRYIYSNKVIKIESPIIYNSEVIITITLQSDIWMPQIFDFRKIIDDNFQMISNKVLYEKNTMRLNRLLNELFLTVKHNGGIMNVEESLMYDVYKPMLHSNFIG